MIEHRFPSVQSGQPCRLRDAARRFNARRLEVRLRVRSRTVAVVRSRVAAPRSIGVVHVVVALVVLLVLLCRGLAVLVGLSRGAGLGAAHGGLVTGRSATHGAAALGTAALRTAALSGGASRLTARRGVLTA